MLSPQVIAGLHNLVTEAGGDQESLETWYTFKTQQAAFLAAADLSKRVSFLSKSEMCEIQVHGCRLQMEFCTCEPDEDTGIEEDEAKEGTE